MPILYDLDDGRLYQLLSRINGVYLTGGGLTLIDPESGEQHQYYKTAKKIYEFSIRQKEQMGLLFPVFGICQGLEALSMLTSADNPAILQPIFYENTQRKITWNVSDPQTGTRMYRGFSQESLKMMAEQDIQFHYHGYGVRYQDYLSNRQMRNFFTVNAIDYDHADKPYVVSMEAKDYPIYAVMFHPEY